jgi:glycosyltransferase involved in cell wall biosynthesis
MSQLQHRWSAQLCATRPPHVVILHVLHSWGGGLEKWATDYSASDSGARHLFLRSIGVSTCSGQRLALFDSASTGKPIAVWELDEPIASVAIAHPEYPGILERIIERFGISRVLVSSFIGHSLDVLLASIPVTVVAHDYFPLCPAIGLYFGSICSSCDTSRLSECASKNPLNTFFPDAGQSRWIDVRRTYTEYVLRRQIPIVAPTESVRRYYCQLLPELLAAPWHIVPHGLDSLLQPLSLHRGSRPRIVVLGRLSAAKGELLLREALPFLLELADVYLIGSGRQAAQRYGHFSHVHARAEYQPAELRSILEAIKPDLGLLMSVVPETFSYTLEELRRSAIPPVATNVGAFADRIQPGHTGFLYEPTPAGLLAVVKQVLDNREQLSAVRTRLLAIQQRAVAEVVQDYKRIQGVRLRWPCDTASLGATPGIRERPRTEQLAYLSQQLLSRAGRQRVLKGIRTALEKSAVSITRMLPPSASSAWGRFRDLLHTSIHRK